jgi:hypothetical protein
MRAIPVKLIISLLTFIVGIFGAAFWAYNTFSSQSSEVAPVMNVEPPSMTTSEDDEQYAIYSLLINDLFLTDNKAVTFVNISDRTNSDDELFYLKKTTHEQRVSSLKKIFPSVNEEILEDFDTKHLLSSPELKPKFNIAVQYDLIDENEINKNEGLASKRVIKFSQVGFNHDKTQAFVDIDYFCPLCGFGKHVLLEKENGKWKIKQEFNGWES